MSDNKEKNGKAEIQFKQNLGPYKLILSNAADEEISLVTLVLTNSNDETIIDIELNGQQFDLFANSLKKFTNVIKDMNAENPKTPPPQPREPRPGFADFF